MKDALDVHRSRLAREVPHEIVRLPRLVLSADEIPDASGLQSERCVAVRLYHADDQVIATVVRAGGLAHPGAVLAALGARTLRVASPEVVNAVTDFAASLVSPVLLPDDVPVLADACIGHHEVVYAATGDGGTVLGIPSRWLLTVSRARVSELCAPASPTVDLADDLTRDLSGDLDPAHDDGSDRPGTPARRWR
jgi:prolyl-tRNA editing enzyme YbaK/EbsC (Cys-tRNA(Pro) deacylase)